MKRICMMLLAAMVFALCACNQSKDPFPNDPPPPAPKTAPDSTKPLTTPGTSLAPSSVDQIRTPRKETTP